MEQAQLAEYKKCETVQERAAFLLNVGVSAKIGIENLTPVFQATVGDLTLPVSGETEQGTIAAGIEWLEEKKAEA